jgi:DNA mismatch repair protein MutL
VRFADNKIIYGCIYSVISAVLDGHTKALDYVVSQPQTAVYADEAVVPTEDKPTPKKVECKAPYTSMFDLDNKTNEDMETKSSPAFDMPMVSYEDAKREMETSAPLFTAKKQGIELPFEVKEHKEEKIPGFIPFDEIETYVPSGKAKKTNKSSKKTVEDLHKKFPDLYFNANAIAAEDAMELLKANQIAEQKKNGADPFEENKRFLEEMERKRKQNRIDISSCTYAGKLFNTYLMYECKDDVYIIDQHAAHERLIFNRLKEKMQNREVAQQPMLMPHEVSLNIFEHEFMCEHLSEICEMGFDAQLETGKLLIYAVPLDLQNIDLTLFFNEILGDISGYRAIRLTDILKDKLASAACKAAVKGGMDLTKEEIDALFALMDGDMGLKCPHGRPVVVKMSRTEIEKMFKRIV